jgi:hypothetical protein
MSKQPSSARDAAPPVSDAAGIVQIKVWPLGISPMVWRRVLVSSACTLRELHGVLQVAMGWEGITSPVPPPITPLRLLGGLGVPAIDYRAARTRAFEL